MRDHDVIIVGAGPAGCAAAYDLAASGISVLLLDRHHFPRVKACAGALTVKALAALRYPIDPVIKRVCRTMGLVNNGGESRVLRSRHALAVSTVRSGLDHFCLAITLEKGVAFEVVREI